MHFTTSPMSPLLFLALGALPSIHAFNPHFVNLTARATTEQCANLVNTRLTVPLSAGSVTIGIVNTCLCTSGIPNFVATNVVAQAAVAVVGQAATTASLTNMIASASNSRTCTFPDNAVPVCLASNPCNFSCTNGFSLISGDCSCPAPKAVCGGVCAADCPGSNSAASSDTPSSTPAVPPTSSEPPAAPSDPPASSDSAASSSTPPASSNPPASNTGSSLVPSATPLKRRLELARRHAACAQGLTVCGVSDWRALNANAKPWECVDALSDLESCGGCVVPFDESSRLGVDCTALAGVEDVQCVSGACRARSCALGYAPSADRTECVHKSIFGSLVHEFVGYL